MLFQGDCLTHLKEMNENLFDSLVTDPPAGISFMGKDWDHHKGGRVEWIAWMSEIMREALRVLKPGAHGFVWALPRTSHWTATALEEAGFEIRDIVTHVFGSGFPKSHDVSKAIDKAAGAKGKILEQRKAGIVNGMSKSRVAQGARPTITVSDGIIRAPATDDAKKWQGFGTALKPASEHWILIRKPCSEKTVAANVLKWGCGALNIDASRIEGKPEMPWGKQHTPPGNGHTLGKMKRISYVQASGRFPANFVLSCCGEDPHEGNCAVGMLDEQSKDTRAGKPSGSARCPVNRSPAPTLEQSGRELKRIKTYETGEVSGASRFFYVAKPSRRERNAGCESNVHPTVKPLKLMRHLIRMITPPDGIVLDPFLGSGTTGVAAQKLGTRFVGIEMNQEYLEIAKARMSL